MEPVMLGNLTLGSDSMLGMEFKSALVYGWLGRGRCHRPDRARPAGQDT